MKKVSPLFLAIMFLFSCGGDDPVTPDPPKPGPTINYFTADPDIIDSGDMSTLDWKTTNASSCSIDQGIGSVDTNWIEFVRPKKTTTYTLTAKNSVGSVTASCTVEVRENADLQVIGNIKKTYWLGLPTFEGQVKNVGDNTAYNAAITIYCYGDTGQTFLIDTAWDYLADGNDIRPGDRVTFEAICFDLSSHNEIKSKRIELDWLEKRYTSLTSLESRKIHENEQRQRELEIKKAREYFKK